MSVIKIGKLCGRLILRNGTRWYSNRNILCLHDRGMIQDLFPPHDGPEMKKLLVGSPQSVYAGFDPSADSLHVGNLLILMNLLHWQRGGHNVLIIVGGATGQIGDPSHRVKERDEIASNVLHDNVESIKTNIETIFSNHRNYFWDTTNKNNNSSLTEPTILNNLDWYKNLNVLDFIKSIGKYNRLGTMMGRTSVQSRLNSEGGMSFTEFTYQIFQAYDWLYLFSKYNCKFQIGGHDQLGNIMSGYDLITRATKKPVYGLTLPLITAEGGKKFGKSLGNAIWLSPKRTSPFNFYQYFIRTEDNDVENFLKLFTFLTLPEIDLIIKNHKLNPDKREAQKILAEHVTLLVHGEEGLKNAQLTTTVLYENSIESLSKLSADQIISIFEGATLNELLLESGMTAYNLAMKINCFKRDNDASRIILAGGFHINHCKITNPNEILTPGIHILSNNISVVRVGKKNYHLVRWL